MRVKYWIGVVGLYVWWAMALAHAGGAVYWSHAGDRRSASILSVTSVVMGIFAYSATRVFRAWKRGASLEQGEQTDG